MWIRYLSDLHLEFGQDNPLALPSIGEDVVVLAGDIHIGVQGIDWALRAIPDRPVLYVLGNHEYYHGHFDATLAQARERARGSHVHVLENDAVTLGGVRFLGCSLWTDFRALGPGTQPFAMQVASGIADYRLIAAGAVAHPRRLVPADTLARHQASGRWLEQALDTAAAPCVVITHHAPSLRACPPRYQGDLLNGAFVNDRDGWLRPPVVAWIFGHTHYSCTLTVNGIPLLSNQRGYPGEPVAFDWDRLFELPAPPETPR